MSDIWSYIISAVSGIVTGVIGTVCYNKLYSSYKKRIREIKKGKLSFVNIFEEYARDKGEAKAIVSFNDQHAITIMPLLHNGIYLVRAEINLDNKAQEEIQRDFVMALLQYYPPADWSYHAECRYNLKFKIRGNIQGVRLEVKSGNWNKNKLIDEHVPVTDCFTTHVYSLSGNAQIWQSVEEICFTVFIEDEYIQGTRGFFEIMDCVLEK